jgi:glycosyltransferase involved in cell wall biosynthesis
MSGRKILQITAYPPPRCGWGVRVQFLKQRLEHLGHACVVLNTGPGRKIPSDEYETVMSGWDYLRKVWRFSRGGFVAHVHTNGKSWHGLVLAIVAEAVNLLWGKRCFLTFHAGEDQTYFPRSRNPWLVPFFWLLFTIPRRIICNNQAVKTRIAEYGISPGKISPIPAFSQQYLEFEPVALGDALEKFYDRFPFVLFCYLHLQASYYPDVLIAAFAEVARVRADVGLVLCGLMGHREETLWRDLQESMTRLAVRERIAVINDLNHDEFLTALSRSSAYVRTVPGDGVSSSVLEALALRVPVVAAENGTRPAGVLTYEATSPGALANRLVHVLDARDEIAAGIPVPTVADTLEDEARLLLA